MTKWSIHIKSLVAAPALLVVSRLTAALLESKWRGNHLVASIYRGVANNIYNYIFGPIFVKLASDFNWIFIIYIVISDYRKRKRTVDVASQPAVSLSKDF